MVFVVAVVVVIIVRNSDSNTLRSDSDIKHKDLSPSEVKLELQVCFDLISFRHAIEHVISTEVPSRMGSTVAEVEHHTIVVVAVEEHHMEKYYTIVVVVVEHHTIVVAVVEHHTIAATVVVHHTVVVAMVIVALYLDCITIFPNSNLVAALRNHPSPQLL